MNLTTSSSYPRFSRSQYVWALLGLAVLVFAAVVAADNFEAIYASQKDFVVGSLLSLTGFCFGRALSRTQEQRAFRLADAVVGAGTHAAVDDEVSGLHPTMPVRSDDVRPVELEERDRVAHRARAPVGVAEAKDAASGVGGKRAERG